MSHEEKQRVENFLVEYNNIFARQRRDIDMNTEFTVKLTLKDDKPVHSQSLPYPVNLKVELDTTTGV